MERLTDKEGSSLVCEGCEEKKYLCKEYCYKPEIKLAEKLAYYEDLEESGKLIKLPYPVGTLLFIPCRKQGVKQDHIRRWQTNNKGLMFCSNGSFYLADAIGKSVFLTREEVENKLKEMSE